MRLIALLLLGLLSGCALLPITPAPVARPAQLEGAAFALNGRIAIKHNGTRHSAGVRWVHRIESDELLLQGPLGQTAARVYRDAQGATLDDGSKHYEAADVETLMQQVLGWQLPLNGLHRWVLGQAADGDAQIERDERGRIAVLKQDGWEVRYLRYDDDSVDSMPSRLQLSRDELQVQLLIDEWEWEKP
ncbi:MAG: outer membrane lipoprotein LolB [Gallionellales bacterium GWA2_59_43]|nr:MAG: outer membrane lipoprotein LolB [Gallionellales bacterium GWA2_59_43]